MPTSQHQIGPMKLITEVKLKSWVICKRTNNFPQKKKTLMLAYGLLNHRKFEAMQVNAEARTDDCDVDMVYVFNSN